MLNTWFQSIVVSDTTSTFSLGTFLICMLVSLVLGVAIAGIHMYRNTYTQGFVMTLALMPAIVQIVIMLVNGNLGTGVAVMGAFSLVRFRSVPGTAREIMSIFLAMAVGLATGMGYLGIAVVFVIIMGMVNAVFTILQFGKSSQTLRELRITIPESLDYTTVFDEILDHYLKHWELASVKTTNMGSLFKLQYVITMKDPAEEKKFMDELRCRNGNLEILCGRVQTIREEL
ncbi:MAG: DUF4956 domain-containing protein [Lachnospiraceae bacterium]|nr:DUF4956 domain-containing protein [Lachnospiraceae bacterium]